MSDTCICVWEHPSDYDRTVATTTIEHKGVKWRACDVHAAMWGRAELKAIFPTLTTKAEARPADMGVAEDGKP